MGKNDQIALLAPRWKLFVLVAQLGSLTKAAVVLESRQSAISMQISQLERECGGRLFSRTGRGVVLTALGEAVLPRVQALLREAEQLGEDIIASSQVPSGEVRVGVVSSTSYPLVNRLYRVVRERYPRIRLQIFEGFSGNLDEWLANGVIDVGLLHRYGRRLPAKEEKLFEGHSFLVSKAHGRRKAPDRVSFSDLNQLPFVLPSRPSGLRILLDQIAARKRIAIPVLMEANSLATVKDVIADGDYYTVLPFQAVFREVKAGVLQASKIVSPGIDRTIALATTTQRPLSAAARETAKIVREVVRELVLTGAWQSD